MDDDLWKRTLRLFMEEDWLYMEEDFRLNMEADF